MATREVTEIDGTEYKRGDSWYVADKRGVPHVVKFMYDTDTTTVVYAKTKINVGQRWMPHIGVWSSASLSPGFHDMTDHLRPGGIDVSSMSPQEIEARQMHGELCDLGLLSDADELMEVIEEGNRAEMATATAAAAALVDQATES